jgi:HK97 family phage portal protein
MGLFKIRERRTNIENPAVPLNSLSLLGLFGGQPTDSGVPVTEYTAMNMSAVYRAVSLISGLAGSLPLQAVDIATKKPVEGTILEDPHPEMTALELWRLAAVHRCLWGNSYLQKVYKRGGKIAYLNPISPDRVTVLLANPITANPSGKIFKVAQLDGKIVPMTPNEIMHIPGIGYDGRCGISPVRAAAQAIGMAQAAEATAARLFKSGNMLSGLLSTEAELDQSQAETLQARWAEKFSGIDGAHKVAVLDSGAKFQSLVMPNDDAQLLESRDFQVTEAARFFGIPPYLMYQTDKTTSWGSGLEQQARGFNQFDLHPNWLAPAEQRITKELLPAGQKARYDIDSLLRGDSIARAEYYRVMREMGAYNVDEIRDLEDLPPLPNGAGQVYLQPINPNAVNAPMGSDKVLGGSSLGPSDGG